jgi:hypothetical protein
MDQLYYKLKNKIVGIYKLKIFQNFYKFYIQASLSKAYKGFKRAYYSMMMSKMWFI